MKTRVDWAEPRNGELFYIIADPEEGGWTFWERSTWEQRWYPLTATDGRIAKADELAAMRSDCVAA
jgi:hypothetical protein